jgi:hypothetical protein
LRENNKLHGEKVIKQNQHELGSKLVVVLGEAGEIGERISRMFLQQGARVLLSSRSKEMKPWALLLRTSLLVNSFHWKLTSVPIKLWKLESRPANTEHLIT